MNKKALTLILALLAGVLLPQTRHSLGGVIVASGAEKTRPTVLRDGYVLRGVDGKLSGTDANEVWFFAFRSDVSDGQIHVPAGTSLQLLPSSALERIAADLTGRPGAGYRLWARVTKYKGRSFLFPFYFLPLSKVQDSGSTTTADANSTDVAPPSQEEARSAVGEPNDTLTIPQEIMQKLTTRPAVRRQQPEEQKDQGQPRRTYKQDFILANRTGFISDSPERGLWGGDQFVFVLDALGRTVHPVSFRLLPCQVLEQVEQQQSIEPDRIRFNTAGIVTEYKGNKYLLLHRATRAYSHGNFGR
jgi:hypothetical protein